MVSEELASDMAKAVFQELRKNNYLSYNPDIPEEKFRKYRTDVITIIETELQEFAKAIIDEVKKMKRK